MPAEDEGFILVDVVNSPFFGKRLVKNSGELINEKAASLVNMHLNYFHIHFQTMRNLAD
jgi:hypothetical protein